MVVYGIRIFERSRLIRMVENSRLTKGVRAVLLVLVFVGSGGTAQGAKQPQTSTGGRTTSTATTKSIASVESFEIVAAAAIPDFDLTDLQNGKTVNLASLRTPNRAMLIWLWAPN